MGHWTYLILILIWALPVIVLQWVIGLDLMLRRWKVWLPAILLPTLYLTFVDSIALNAHTWTIDPEQSLNIFLPSGVPVEEMIFFLVTDTLVAQGLILIAMPGIQGRVRRLLRMLRRGPKSLSSAADTQENPAVPSKGD